MEIPELGEIIKSLQNEGKSKEDIYSQLLSGGAKISDIETAFLQLSKSSSETDTHQKTIHIILTLAAFLIGAGIFSFIASNWEAMGKVQKVVVIITSMLASYALGWYVREIKKYERTGNAFVLLGLFIYGAGIFLIGQIFNIRGNWPDAYILWMFGVIAMAFALDLFNLFYFAIVLAGIALFGHHGGFFQSGSFTPDQFLQTSFLMLFLATGACFVTGAILRRRLPPEIKELY